MTWRAAPSMIALSVILVVAACSEGPPEASNAAKIGFIFVGERGDLGYNQAAWEGADAVARTFPDQRVLRAENVPETEQAITAMEAMIDDGATILFATSFGHLRFAYEIARRHPKVIVVHQGGTEPTPKLPNFGTYWGTVYQPVYQAGVVAGSVSKSGKLGYVVAFPIPATFANVNAFLLGARSVNRRATVHVRFTKSWCDHAVQRSAAAALLRDGADVLAQHQDCTKTILVAAETAGAASVGYHADGSEVAPNGWLVGPVWNWRSVYSAIVTSALSGRFAAGPHNGDYRSGYGSGQNPFVLTDFGPRVPVQAQRAVAAAESRFTSGAPVFAPPLADRDGRVRFPAGVNPTVEQVDSMNFFVSGVVGAIPS